MRVRLIYHQPGEPQGTVSPIDEAIDQMVRGQQHVDIACPYIGLSYLKRIVKQASFRLLSDVDQWIISQAKNSRSNICNFITSNSKSIRHYPDLHAKVIIAGEKAMVGSANLTEKGMTKRIEMCMLFENKRRVEELRDWFNGLWPLSNLVKSDQLSRLIHNAPTPTKLARRYRLSSEAPRIKSKLAFSTKKASASVAKNSRKADDRRLEPAVDVDYPNSVSERTLMSMEADKQRSRAVKVAIDAVVDSSRYIEGIHAAAEIIGASRERGFSREQVRNLIKTGQLDNYGKGGRYDKFKFLRSDLERLAIPENRKKPGRRIGSKKTV
jgi:hypothetical protein